MESNADQRRTYVYDALQKHIRSFFQGHPITELKVTSLRVLERLPRLGVLEIGPGPKGNVWAYISFGAWEIIDDNLTSMEFFILAPKQNDRHVELLEMLAYYHSLEQGKLGLGHTVPIDEPWLEGSQCDHFLISHPYPYSPAFEHCKTEDFIIHLFWALPITKAERDFKVQYGLEALERLFEQAKIPYWQPDRLSVA